MKALQKPLLTSMLFILFIFAHIQHAQGSVIVTDGLSLQGSSGPLFQGQYETFVGASWDTDATLLDEFTGGRLNVPNPVYYLQEAVRATCGHVRVGATECNQIMKILPISQTFKVISGRVECITSPGNCASSVVNEIGGCVSNLLGCVSGGASGLANAISDGVDTVAEFFSNIFDGFLGGGGGPNPNDPYFGVIEGCGINLFDLGLVISDDQEKCVGNEIKRIDREHEERMSSLRDQYNDSMSQCRSQTGFTTNECLGLDEGDNPIISAQSSDDIPSTFVFDTTTGVKVELESQGQIGLMPSVGFDSGAVDYSAELGFGLKLPETVSTGELFEIEFEGFVAEASLNVDEPSFNIGLDAVFDVETDLDIEACVLGVCPSLDLGFDLPSVDFDLLGALGVGLSTTDNVTNIWYDKNKGVTTRPGAGASNIATITTFPTDATQTQEIINGIAFNSSRGALLDLTANPIGIASIGARPLAAFQQEYDKEFAGVRAAAGYTLFNGSIGASLGYTNRHSLSTGSSVTLTFDQPVSVKEFEPILSCRTLFGQRICVPSGFREKNREIGNFVNIRSGDLVELLFEGEVGNIINREYSIDSFLSFSSHLDVSPVVTQKALCLNANVGFRFISQDIPETCLIGDRAQGSQSASLTGFSRRRQIGADILTFSDTIDLRNTVASVDALSNSNSDDSSSGNNGSGNDDSGNGVDAGNGGSNQDVTDIPEPSTISLLLVTVCAMAFRRQRKSRALVAA